MVQRDTVGDTDSSSEGKPRSSITGSRRNFLRTTGVGMTAAALAGCLGDDEVETITVDGEELAAEITIMAWGGSAQDAMEDFYAEPFEEETGVTVNVVGASSGHEMVSRIQGGAEDVHIINPEEIDVYEAIENGHIHPIRTENLSNYDKIQDELVPEEAIYDPGEDVHHIPHIYGGTGITYNHEEVEEPDSWMDIMTDELQGSLIHFDYPNYIVGQAAIALGMDMNEAVQDEAMMDEVWDFVEERNEHVAEWSNSGSSTMEAFTSESALAGSLWVGRQTAIERDGVPVSYTVPEEGAYFWVNVLNIPSYVEDPHRITAEKFIDYLISEEPTAEYVQDQVYAPSIEYTETEPPEIIEENPDVANLDLLTQMDPALYQEYVDDWQERFEEIVRG
ncbi:extracellular solute-binding protein (plasmid) [Natronorubrum bangense]|uniref:Extracellular solute-binding protein n=2 Tax=Natronorubrum bangense TaxID=61858 RepID=A0A4D6HR36_9EURY|nr:extracellular solute-binding protein [Natronorubrum bangense]